mgnify:CR=1 FL=1
MVILPYNQIIGFFEQATNEHLGYNAFGSGPIDYLDSQSQNTLYPLLFARPLNSPGLQDNTKTLNFELEGMKLILSLTGEEKKGALRLFGKSGLDLMSDDVASAHLMQEMKKNPKTFFDIITDKEIKDLAKKYGMDDATIAKKLK